MLTWHNFVDDSLRTNSRLTYQRACKADNIFAGGGDFGGIDFSKLGGGAGLGGEEEEEEEEDDEDMPPLEGEEDEKATGAAKTAA